MHSNARTLSLREQQRWELLNKRKQRISKAHYLTPDSVLKSQAKHHSCSIALSCQPGPGDGGTSVSSMQGFNPQWQLEVLKGDATELKTTATVWRLGLTALSAELDSSSSNSKEVLLDNQKWWIAFRGDLDTECWASSVSTARQHWSAVQVTISHHESVPDSSLRAIAMSQ